MNHYHDALISMIKNALLKIDVKVDSKKNLTIYLNLVGHEFEVDLANDKSSNDAAKEAIQNLGHQIHKKLNDA